MHPNVHSSTIYNSQVLEATQVPVSKRMDPKTMVHLHMEFYAAERKKELLPFATAWMELESILLSEISQAVKDKYGVILLLTNLINKANKQAKHSQRH